MAKRWVLEKKSLAPLRKPLPLLQLIDKVWIPLFFFIFFAGFFLFPFPSFLSPLASLRNLCALCG
jgi:hypothetical protein